MVSSATEKALFVMNDCSQHQATVFKPDDLKHFIENYFKLKKKVCALLLKVRA